jgi:hypothetical protein
MWHTNECCKSYIVHQQVLVIVEIAEGHVVILISDGSSGGGGGIIDGGDAPFLLLLLLVSFALHAVFGKLKGRG